MHKPFLWLRFLLKLIDLTLASNTTTGGMLWDVMSALRGPDNYYSLPKATTTAIVRAKAFPWTAWRGRESINGFTIPATFNPDGGLNEVDKAITVAWSSKPDMAHVSYHLRQAVFALRRIGRR